ncbi:hypothetical protein L6Q79_01470 [bacterium]|nr:hypothetical protein [bacterium]NUN45579.1 hypothetical protein [bacterium]
MRTTLNLWMFCSLVFLGCDSHSKKNQHEIIPPAETEIAVSGLTTDEQAIHDDGRELFFTKFTIDDGLGPFFAEQSCGLCHEGAGRGPGKVLRIGRTTNGSFDPMAEFGGPTIQFRTALENRVPETVPPEAQFVNFRVAPPMWGRGFIQEIPAETIVANADPNDADADGISGRANYIIMSFVDSPTHPELGRHGIKAQMSRILDFADNAFLHDLGMTSPMRPYELVNPNARDAKDKKSGVDIRHDDVEKVDFFIRTSDFPPMLPETGNIPAGKTLFSTIGCNKCHIPAMTTGASEIAALSNKTVFFYSDFLLHDMGQALSDGVLDGDAKPQEFKTPTLRGLRFFKDFLHDGRAKSTDEAIRMHGGEATSVRDNFIGLTQDDRDAIIAFLNSL